jgi:two-component system chemotaxis sensor kinase CheA
MMDLDRKLLLSAFRDEAEELLGELERLALDLDAQPGNRGLVEQMFRCAHTLKGSASCVGFESVIAIAHQLESLFEEVTTKRRAPGRWLSGVSLDEEREAPIAGGVELVERIVALLASDAERAEAVVWSAGPLGGSSRAARSLRVDVDRLDALLNLAGEVAVAQGRLGALLDPASAAHTALLAFQGLFQTLQESVMRLRSVPASNAFAARCTSCRNASTSKWCSTSRAETWKWTSRWPRRCATR